MHTHKAFFLITPSDYRLFTNCLFRPLPTQETDKTELPTHPTHSSKFRETERESKERGRETEVEKTRGDAK